MSCTFWNRRRKKAREKENKTSFDVLEKEKPKKGMNKKRGDK